jgi:hypothetical protein
MANLRIDETRIADAEGRDKRVEFDMNQDHPFGVRAPKKHTP